MECCEELTLSLYAEGELEEADAERVAAHLPGCERCRRLVRALAIEESSLRTALAESAGSEAGADMDRDHEGCRTSAARYDGLLPERALTGSLSPVWALAAAAALVLGLSAGLDCVRRPPLPAALGWTPSVAFSVSLDWLSVLVVAALAEASRAVPIACALVLGGLLLRRPWGRPAAAASLALLALVSSTPAGATELRTARNGQNTVVIPAGETVDDTLVVSADTVIVEGVVTGDLVALGGQVRLAGRTGGSLLCLARRLDVDGQVGGDVYAVVDSIGVRGRIERNLHLAAKRSDLARGSVVARDVFAFAQEVRLGGEVRRDVRTRANETALAGTVGGDADLVSDSVSLEPAALVGGDLVARTQEIGGVRMTDQAQVRGAKRLSSEPSSEVYGPRYLPSRFREPSFYLWQGLWLAASLMAASLAFALAPTMFEEAPRSAVPLLKAAGIGFLVLAATPIGVVVLALTVVGLPVALAAGCGWVATVYLSFVFTAAWLGKLVLRQTSAGFGRFLLAVLVGEILLRVATHLPFVDSALWLLALVLGCGLAMASLSRLWRRLRAS